MSRTSIVDAVILHAYDIGEADRFCILLTREKGRLPVLARGARKLSSRIGGTLLPLQQARVELHESDSGWYLRSAEQIAEPLRENLEGFLQATQAAELLMALLEDDHPVPEIYDAFLTFIEGCRRENSHAFTAFQCRFLHLLGILPAVPEIIKHANLSSEEELFIIEAVKGSMPSSNEERLSRITSVLERLLLTHSTRALKAKAVAVNMEID